MGKITVDPSSLAAAFSSQDTQKEEKEKIKLVLSPRLLPSQEHSVGCSGLSWVPGTSTNGGSFAVPQPNSSSL